MYVAPESCLRMLMHYSGHHKQEKYSRFGIMTVACFEYAKSISDISFSQFHKGVGAEDPKMRLRAGQGFFVNRVEQSLWSGREVTT